MWRRVLTGVLVVAVVAAGVALSIWVQRREPLAGGRPSGPDPLEASSPIELQARRVRAPAPGELYWGAFRQEAPYARGLVEDLHAAVGSWPSILMWYQEWEGEQLFDVGSAEWLLDRGVVPMVSWEPWKPPAQFGDLVVEQPEYRLERIANGAFDRYIAAYATAIADWGGPVMLRPFHEMDGFWYPWGGMVNGNSPATFVAAWRRLHQVFESVGARNVTWVWSVNNESVPDTAENHISNYWPGDRYVDWIGISGFNWGAAGYQSTWKPFGDVYRDRYADVLSYQKPIVLTEVGAPEVGGDKASWINEAFQTIDALFPKMRALVWYDKRDSAERDWRIESSLAALEAFREAIGRPGILSAPAAAETAVREL